MTNTIIKVENLGKRYRIGVQESQPESLREVIGSIVDSSFRYLRQMSRPPTEEETLWALRNVSFEVKSGEVLGIIGRNGAGKSTLLKILSRITEPTEGRAVLDGRVGSLLEVGTGFHPELTGRENTYLNGAILGMKKREIDRKFDEIVAFAEIEKFLDTPVKRYSSGMYVRLAFAVAAHLETEILLLDEVLAVGDVAFRRKCQTKIEEVARVGRTILFVSHNTMSIRRLCSRAIWLDEGGEIAEGQVEDILQTYLGKLTKPLSIPAKIGEESANRREYENEAIVITNRDYGLDIEGVYLKNSRGEQSFQFHPGEDLIIEVRFNATRVIEKPYIWIAVDGLTGPCFGANMLLDGHRPSTLEGDGFVRCRFKSIPLLPQSYTVRIAIRANDGVTGIVEPQEVAYFHVVGDLRKDYGFRGDFVENLASRSVPIIIPYEWILPDGSVRSTQLFKLPVSSN